MIDSKLFVKLCDPIWSDPVWDAKPPGNAWRVSCWTASKTTRSTRQRGHVWPCPRKSPVS